jgi:hypothetical protein
LWLLEVVVVVVTVVVTVAVVEEQVVIGLPLAHLGVEHLPKQL